MGQHYPTSYTDWTILILSYGGLSGKNSEGPFGRGESAGEEKLTNSSRVNSNQKAIIKWSNLDLSYVPNCTRSHSFVRPNCMTTELSRESGLTQPNIGCLKAKLSKLVSFSHQVSQNSVGSS